MENYGRGIKQRSNEPNKLYEMGSAADWFLMFQIGYIRGLFFNESDVYVSFPQT